MDEGGGTDVLTDPTKAIIQADSTDVPLTVHDLSACAASLAVQSSLSEDVALIVAALAVREICLSKCSKVDPWDCGAMMTSPMLSEVRDGLSG